MDVTAALERITTLVGLIVALVVLPSCGQKPNAGEPSAHPVAIYSVWPFDAKEAIRRQDETARALGVSKECALDLGRGCTMEAALIPPGTVVMGSSKAEKDASADTDKDSDQHEVTITKPFYLGIYPVTQAQYQAVMGKNPSYFKGPNNPVEEVLWEDAADFCNKLSHITGRTVRLPTEAQWEYACRAGTDTPFNMGRTVRPEQANYGDEFLYGPDWVEDKTARKHQEGTTPVGSFKPNAWGLYDMHGNVWQYCSDWYAEIPREEIAAPVSEPDDGDDDSRHAPAIGRPLTAIDPTGPTADPSPSSAYHLKHVMRGGCWQAFAWTCRSAYREGIPAGGRYSGGGGYFGFRVEVDALPATQSTTVPSTQEELTIIGKLAKGVQIKQEAKTLEQLVAGIRPDYVWAVSDGLGEGTFLLWVEKDPHGRTVFRLEQAFRWKPSNDEPIRWVLLSVTDEPSDDTFGYRLPNELLGLSIPEGKAMTEGDGVFADDYTKEIASGKRGTILEIGWAPRGNSGNGHFTYQVRLYMWKDVGGTWRFLGQGPTTSSERAGCNCWQGGGIEAKVKWAGKHSRPIIEIDKTYSHSDADDVKPDLVEHEDYLLSAAPDAKPGLARKLSQRPYLIAEKGDTVAKIIRRLGAWSGGSDVIWKEILLDLNPELKSNQLAQGQHVVVPTYVEQLDEFEKRERTAIKAATAPDAK